MAHREGIREFLKDVQVHGLVHDWGCGTKPIKDYLSPNKAKFLGLDKLSHVGADIICDFETPHEFVQHADFAFCLEVIEHVWNSNMLLSNIYKNLKKGGVLYLSQPFLYEVHKEDDVRRYTYNGLTRLLEETGFTVEKLVATEGALDKAAGYIVRARK